LRKNLVIFLVAWRRRAGYLPLRSILVRARRCMRLDRLRRRLRLEEMPGWRRRVVATMRWLSARHRLIELARRTIGLGCGVAQVLGIGYRFAETAQALV